MSSRLLRNMILGVVALCSVAGRPVQAQSSTTEAQRRIKVAVKPDYSALAKHLNLTGIVRVEVQIAADGRVKKAHVVGGHPVLAIEAEKAALLTEFEAAPKETTQTIEFRFGS